MGTVQKISVCLWFADQAEEAAAFYVSVFERSRVVEVSRYGEGAPLPAGTALMVVMDLDGVEVQALNGGPGPTFSVATSLVVHTQSQDETDRLWAALTSGGGAPGRCGWLTDRYGVSWQVVPDRLVELLSTPDRAAGQRVMTALMLMDKIVVPDLEAAAEGR